MWIFTRYGFYSVVCARKRKADVDTNRMTVRARVRDHLARLQKAFPVLASLAITETLDSDYRYRLFVSKATWKTVIAGLADEIAYDNFKQAAGGVSAEYRNALHDVWSVMSKLQPTAPGRRRFL